MKSSKNLPEGLEFEKYQSRCRRIYEKNVRSSILHACSQRQVRRLRRNKLVWRVHASWRRQRTRHKEFFSGSTKTGLVPDVACTKHFGHYGIEVLGKTILGWYAILGCHPQGLGKTTSLRLR